MLTLDILRHYILSKRAGALVRTISWICMGGMGIGMFALIVVISVMNGFNNSLRNRLLAVEPHLTISIDHKKPETFWNQLQADLNKRKGAHAYRYESQDVVVRTVDGYIGGGVARGMSSEALRDVLHRVAQRQKASPDPDVRIPMDSNQLHPGEVLMGVDLAINLGVFENSEIVLVEPEALLLPKGEIPKSERLKVAGILSTNVADVDSKMIYYVRGQSLNNLRQSASLEDGIEVRFDQVNDAPVVQADLAKQGIQSETWAQRNSALFHALWLEKTAIGLFLSLSALIASFSIVAVLTLLMIQKQRDLGILMALGLPQKKAQWVFTQIGLILSLGGIFSGLVLGLLASYLIHRFPVNILPEVYHDRSIPSVINYQFVALAATIALVIAFVSSWVPALRASRMTPAEALRSQSRDQT